MGPFIRERGVSAAGASRDDQLIARLSFNESVLFFVVIRRIPTYGELPVMTYAGHNCSYICATYILATIPPALVRRAPVVLGNVFIRRALSYVTGSEPQRTTKTGVDDDRQLMTMMKHDCMWKTGVRCTSPLAHTLLLVLRTYRLCTTTGGLSGRTFLWCRGTNQRLQYPPPLCGVADSGAKSV